MIGKPQWFKRRKYGGWGLFPATWQGVAYVGVFVAIVALIQALPIDETIKLTITFGLVILLILDVVDIMRKLPMDERERIHEAISERNALWTMIVVLVAGLGYQSVMTSMTNSFQIDPVILIALLAATAAKAISNLYLDRKN